jgi:ribose 5-phosphate isomerase A
MNDQQDLAKKAAAEKAVALVRDGMTLGLGTGSTASFAIRRIGQLVRAGMKLSAVATSIRSEQLAREEGIVVKDISGIVSIDLAIDGADEADGNGNLIKGGGGALLREKIIAFHSDLFVVIVDPSKLVEVLGKFRLPVELLPFGAGLAMKEIERMGGKPLLRKAGGQPYVTDNGNLIADCDSFRLRSMSLFRTFFWMPKNPP